MINAHISTIFKQYKAKRKYVIILSNYDIYSFKYLQRFNQIGLCDFDLSKPICDKLSR